MSKYGVISGPYFPVLGLNTEIQSEYKKIRTRNNSVFEHFSRSEVSNCNATKKGGVRIRENKDVSYTELDH